MLKGDRSNPRRSSPSCAPVKSIALEIEARGRGQGTAQTPFKGRRNEQKKAAIAAQGGRMLHLLLEGHSHALSAGQRGLSPQACRAPERHRAPRDQAAIVAFPEGTASATAPQDTTETDYTHQVPRHPVPQGPSPLFPAALAGRHETPPARSPSSGAAQTSRWRRDGS